MWVRPSLRDTIHLGYNGLVSDLDIVFHANPFVYLDQLKEYAMTAWIEGHGVKVNTGFVFARGDLEPNGEAGGSLRKNNCSIDAEFPPPSPPPPSPLRICMSIHPERESCGHVRSRLECLFSMSLQHSNWGY
jgi:hypothetical protein